MTHEELGELYELYALGVLEPDAKAEIESHVASNCAQCKTGVKNALGLNTFLATLPDDVALPKDLKKRVLSSIGAEPQTYRFWMGAWALVASALAILVVIVGIQNNRRAQELAGARPALAGAREEISRSSAELSKVHAALQLLNEPETKQVVFGAGQPQPPRGRVFVNRQRGVLLLASNLPAVPAGKIFEMWLIPKGGAPRPAGLFQSDAQGNALYVLSGAVDPTTAVVAVTVEPEAGSQAPTSTPIIVAALTD